MTREIKFFRNYFIDFYIAQDSSVQEKIEYVLKVIRTVDRIPEKFLKHIEGTDGLYEIRIMSGSDIYRIFCCFESGGIVILFHVFQKKSKKIPRKEVDKGLRLKDEFFKEMKGISNESH